MSGGLNSQGWDGVAGNPPPFSRRTRRPARATETYHRNRSQPTATVFACLSRFRVPLICHRLLRVATALLHSARREEAAKRRISAQACEHARGAQYVDDRPYVASSFLSVAISRVSNTALGGRSKERRSTTTSSTSSTSWPSRSSLGTGRRLFGSTADKTTWKLAEPKTVGEGVLITVFQRATDESRRSLRSSADRSQGPHLASPVGDLQVIFPGLVVLADLRRAADGLAVVAERVGCANPSGG